MIPGLELSRRFYFEAVKPILDSHFPGLPHAAARIGPGSDVLGFDTEMSRDHDWGPAVQIFLRDDDLSIQIRDMMSAELPAEFCGYPVGFSEPNEHGIQITQINGQHRVTPTTLRDFVWKHLHYEIDTPLDVIDWLTIPAQKLREMTSGTVHFDNMGELTALREKLAWYPHDVWLYLMAAVWQRIGQEEHLMPRAGVVGDALGSGLIASRLVRDIMNLCFLMERQYAPYSKWFGTAFRQLESGAELYPILQPEQAIGEAYEILARKFNALKLTPPLPEKVSNFHDRPFKVIHGGDFADALIAQIADPTVKRITSRPLIGGIDQFSDNTDLVSNASWRSTLRKLYSEDL